MMRKLLFTAHWTAEEAEIIMTFLDELKEIIAQNYKAELNEYYQAEFEQKTKDDEQVDTGVNDKITF